MSNNCNIPNTINGPFNAVRMEGNVNEIKKVIYLFADIHLNLGKQTKCRDFKSLDISQYLSLNFQNIDKPIDFMFEISKTDTNLNEKVDYKLRYIENVFQLFNSEFSVKNGKVNKSKSNALIRYHYIDIRDYFHDTINKYEYFLNNIIDNFFQILPTNTNLMDILELLDLLKKEFSMLYENLTNDGKTNKKNEKKIQNKDDEIKIPQFINKIKESYNHIEIKNKIDIILNNYLKIFNDIIESINNIKIKINNYIPLIVEDRKLIYDKNYEKYKYGNSYLETLKFIIDIYAEYNKLANKSIACHAILMDLYFTRRFLDKDYIQTAVVYTGGYHTIDYIQILLTKFDFKITHFSYSLEKDINKLNEELKKHDDILDKREYERNFYPEYLTQCSDLSTFPKNFE